MSIMMPIHPGEILKEEIMAPRKISQIKLAGDIGVPLLVIRGICQSKKSIDADVALRLSIYFGTSFEFWLNLQQNYDLRMCKRQEAKVKKQISPLPKSTQTNRLRKYFH